MFTEGLCNKEFSEMNIQASPWNCKMYSYANVNSDSQVAYSCLRPHIAPEPILNQDHQNCKCSEHCENPDTRLQVNSPTSCSTEEINRNCACKKNGFMTSSCHGYSVPAIRLEDHRCKQLRTAPVDNKSTHHTKQAAHAFLDLLVQALSYKHSGASTVAIDHKIEQAMDLVKSHLMFAVHEEVMVLKEQIKELLEKNSQLEIENNILRSSATPETLAKLSQATPAASSQSSSS